ncbi:MAG TPA: sulfate ABC transporter permease subunit [Nitrospiraceae bacterium]|nr:sulfate ABC transporter permease subunit [Nitrospiraceae bacterium]
MTRRFLIGSVWAYFLLLLIGPLLYLVAQSFTEGPGAFWHEITKPQAVHGFVLTAQITAVVLVVNLIFGTITALVLVRQQFPGRTFLSGLIDLPFAVSPVIAGFMLILLFGPDTILGAFFGSLGVKVLFALPAMVLATLFVTFPFVVRELTPLLQTIGTEGEEAARTLGASEWQVFYKVTLPALRWGLVYGATLTTARAIGEFGAVLVVSGNILLLTQTATLHIYQNYVDFNYVGANAVAFTLLAVSFAILVVLEIAKARAHAAVEQP